MFNGLDAHFADQLRALNLRAWRSEVLASNIANADTPNYKARDFDFAGALRQALGAPQRIALARTAERHLSGTRGSQPPVALQYRIPVQPSIDGNTVELDTELGQFSDNALRMQAELTFMSNRIRNLVAAIQG